MNTIARVTLLLGALSLVVSTAPAQYFGRNAVQYRRFQFKILKTQHFDIYFYDKEAAAAAEAGRMAERWYTRISTVLRHQLSGRQPLILYSDHPDYNQTNILPVEGSEGITESLKRRIILPMGASLAETDHVIGHELTTAFPCGSSKGWPSTSRSATSIPTRRCGCATPCGAASSRVSEISRTPGTSRTAGVSRSGRIWAARTAMTSSARYCARPAAAATCRPQWSR